MATAASAAKHIFISTSRFRDLVANGTITHQKPGEYRLETVRREYITNAQRVMQRRGENGGKALSEQRARLADVQAQRAEFLLLKDQGQFVELTLMQTMLTRAFGVFREQSMSMPGKWADALQPHTALDRAAIHEVLRVEIADMLRDFSNPDGLCAQAADEPAK